MATQSGTRPPDAPAPTVQWQLSTDGGKSFANLTGRRSSTLSFTATRSHAHYRYRAVSQALLTVR